MSTDLTRLTASDLAAKLTAGEVSSVHATQAHLDRIATVDSRIHAFLHVNDEAALDAGAEVDARRAAGADVAPLAGAPIAVKDVAVATGQHTSAGSKILQGWTAADDATLVQRLRAAGMTTLGKTNMDEIAMGSSTENSAYGPTSYTW